MIVDCQSCGRKENICGWVNLPGKIFERWSVRKAFNLGFKRPVFYN
jgi:hypothetical protein